MVTEEQALEKVSEKYPLFKYPICAAGTLGQAMTLGYRALMFSGKEPAAMTAPPRRRKALKFPPG